MFAFAFSYQRRKVKSDGHQIDILRRYGHGIQQELPWKLPSKSARSIKLFMAVAKRF